MSLINDALKRASAAKPPLDPDVSAPALRPAEDRPRSVWGWVWCAVGLMLAGFLATWAILMGVLADHEIKVNQVAAAREIKMAANPVPAVVETPVPARSAQSVPSNTTPSVPEERALGGTNPEEAANPSTNGMIATPVQVEPPKPAAPVLKLQGIILRPSRPQAMINAKLVVRGDKILNARVVAIDQESVTLDQGGQTVILTLPQ